MFPGVTALSSPGVGWISSLAHSSPCAGLTGVIAIGLSHFAPTLGRDARYWIIQGE